MPSVRVSIADVEDIIEELGLFSKFFTEKRPALTNEQEKWLLKVLKTGAFGSEYFINITDSVLPGQRKYLPEIVFVKRGRKGRRELLSCKCKGGKLCGTWPYNRRMANCKKQKLFLSTLYITIANTLLRKKDAREVNGFVVLDNDDACLMHKEICLTNQHATQSD